ncbi:hypothetical protein N7463_002655 [Penicillium fimorum]|uniref:Uncharacterized protein n=1 Tax=Penicillium fimorum TaxID=1882269 RepID=A0A9W9XZU7_9EURO|nr:hypothetical protein N7463_002655 [Penicillium fimorum]
MNVNAKLKKHTLNPHQSQTLYPRAPPIQTDLNDAETHLTAVDYKLYGAEADTIRDTYTGMKQSERTARDRDRNRRNQTKRKNGEMEQRANPQSDRYNTSTRHKDPEQTGI